MERKNLLLGNGELLTENIEPPGGGGPKAHPYTFSQARDRLLPRLNKLIKQIDKVPDKARPGGLEVAKFTLHPAYLAKTYYPQTLFKKTGLRNIGSKEVNIKPEMTTHKESKGEEATACFYVAGTQNTFEAFMNHLEASEFNKGMQDDIRKIEDIEIFKGKEKIKYIDKKSKWLDVVLHADMDEPEIIKAFNKYVKSLGGKADIDRKITIGGLTFMPVKASAKKVKDISKFSMLRAVRSMPELRFGEPDTFRSVISDAAPELPGPDVLNDEISVAIFDGGIGSDIDDLEPWVTEHIKTPSNKTASYMLKHGGDVTSAFLFGRVEDGQTELPQPYAKVDHYRVISNENDTDPDLYDVLHNIKSVLEDGRHSFINLSLGPRLPVDDDDVHVWTSTLEHYLSDGNVLATIAVGNDGDKSGIYNRIQPPSDMVNGLAVGAADSYESEWYRARYSCIGPGRSPGRIKPDGVTFGGDSKNPLPIYSPWDGLAGVIGTSFSAPLTMRAAVGVAASLNYPLTPMSVKALLIHHTEKNGEERHEVGWGRFPEDIGEIITSADNEATLIYQGVLTAGQHLKAPIPFPNIELKGNITLTATFCYASKFDPEHPVNYTRSGLEIVFRKNPDGDTSTFFSRKTMYPTEQQMRSDSHKWETTLHNSSTFRKTSLQDPSFEIVYRAREGGKSVPNTKVDPLPYSLVVTLKVNNTPEVYNNILQRYSVLQPVKLQGRVMIAS